MLSGKSLFDFRAEQSFKLMDTNNSSTLTLSEVRAYVIESIQGQHDEGHLEEDLKKWKLFDKNNDGEFDLEEFKVIYRKMINGQIQNLK